MAKIIFNLNGIEMMIQCNIKETMKDLTLKYATKSEKDVKDLIFIYGGDKIKPELTFERQANAEDIKRKQMNILVYESKNFNNNDISKKGLEEKEIDNLKEKINFILSKYFADRKYLENKVDNWRDAI